MELEIKHHADGTRYVRPYLGTNAVTGAPIRPYHRFPDAKTDEEALAAAKVWIAEVAPAANVGATHRLGDLLARYVRWVEANGRSANTVKTYRSFLRYAEPLAAKPAREVRTYEIEMLYHHLLAGRDDGGMGLGAGTVIAFHWFLSGAFRWMCSLGAADTNPVRDAEKPEPGVYEAVAFEAQDFAKVSKILERLAMERCEPNRSQLLQRESAHGAWIALNTGLRCGEVCALRKRDAELFRKSLHVGGTVVEARGRVFRQDRTKGRRARNVALSDEACAALRSHERLVEDTFGRRPRPTGVPLCTYAATAPWIRPSTMSRAFRAICDANGLPKEATFHSLRHTHATWLLLGGMDPKTVSERLGHSSVKVTLEIYAHVLPGRDAQAAELFSRVARDAGEW